MMEIKNKYLKTPPKTNVSNHHLVILLPHWDGANLPAILKSEVICQSTSTLNLFGNKKSLVMGI